MRPASNATQVPNVAGNHDTAHGFAFIRADVTRTDTTAATDTKPTTNTNITPVIFPLSVSFTQPNTRMQSASSVEVPAMKRIVERYSLPAVIAGAVAMFAVIASTLLLVVQANDRADTFQARYNRTQTAVHDLCVRREGLEVRLRDLERVDVWLQRRLTDLDRADPARVHAYQRKLAADRAYLRTPVEDGCEQLLPTD